MERIPIAKRSALYLWQFKKWYPLENTIGFRIMAPRKKATLIKEKMDLEVEVAKLRMLKSEYQSTQYQLEDRLLKRYPEQIKKKEAQIAGIKFFTIFM